MTDKIVEFYKPQKWCLSYRNGFDGNIERYDLVKSKDVIELIEQILNLKLEAPALDYCGYASCEDGVELLLDLLKKLKGVLE